MNRLVLIAAPVAFFLAWWIGPAAPQPIRCAPFTPEQITAQIASEQRQKDYDRAEETAARIFRSHGCSDEYAEYAGHNAVDFRVPARVVAALIVVESTCRPTVVSNEGAVGLTQVMPRTWKVSREELMDPAFNIHKGTEILAGYVRAHGLREGLHRYNGLGVGCSSCDPGYSDRVLLVAGYRVVN